MGTNMPTSPGFYVIYHNGNGLNLKPAIFLSFIHFHKFQKVVSHNILFI